MHVVTAVYLFSLNKLIERTATVTPPTKGFNTEDVLALRDINLYDRRLWHSLLTCRTHFLLDALMLRSPSMSGPVNIVINIYLPLVYILSFAITMISSENNSNYVVY